MEMEGGVPLPQRGVGRRGRARGGASGMGWGGGKSLEH